ncbi:MAG: hypothetical protein ABI548_21290 [Polyangiaceae bacterium]
MGKLHLVLPWVMVLGCGGSAVGEPSSGAGAPSGGQLQAVGSAGTSSSGAGAANGGTAAAGGAAAGGAAAESGSGGNTSSGGTLQGQAAGASGAAGQPASSDCVELSCLAGAEFIYQPTRQWQSSGAVQDSNSLSEADYTPRLADALSLKFSSDATQLEITPTAGGQAVLGTRDAQRSDRAWYNLKLFAGGRFVVQANGGAFQAEHTIYGSGAPILSSTRGALEAP